MIAPQNALPLHYALSFIMGIHQNSLRNAPGLAPGSFTVNMLHLQGLQVYLFSIKGVEKYPVLASHKYFLAIKWPVSYVVFDFCGRGLAR